MTVPPGYIRVFACTDASPLGLSALHYVKALLRIAPVRVISVSPNGLDGAWRGYTSLLATPMTGTFVNVVACDPARWAWLATVPMPSSNVEVAELATAASSPADSEAADPFAAVPSTETATAMLELYTPSVRNVLLAIVAPRSKVELDSAMKYQAVIVPTPEALRWWRERDLERHPILAGREPDFFITELPRITSPIAFRVFRDLVVPPRFDPTQP